jgi:hypothetical protein
MEVNWKRKEKHPLNLFQPALKQILRNGQQNILKKNRHQNMMMNQYLDLLLRIVQSRG